MDDASDMVLFDELVFTRARALSVTKALKGMFADPKRQLTWKPVLLFTTKYSKLNRPLTGILPVSSQLNAHC